MEHKSFKFELKALTDEGTFQGYASTFGNVDLGGDVIEPGAFGRTLNALKGKVVLLDFHRADMRLGAAYLEEDAKGLKVTKGVLNLNKQAGKDMLEDLRFYKEHGIPMEMSIGYDTITKDVIDNVRHLKEIKLWEVSLITPKFAMNPRAQVGNVKADEEAVARIASLETQNQALLQRVTELEGKVGSTPAGGPAAPPPDPGDHSGDDVKALLLSMQETRILIHRRSVA